MQMQLERLDVPARPGVAFSLVRKLLEFRDPAPRVEVVILSRNDPVSGMRAFRSAKHYGLPIERGTFTRGRSPWRYLKPLGAHLFTVGQRRGRALRAGGRRAGPRACFRIRHGPRTRTRTRSASPSTATRCCSPTRAERVYQAHGLDAFQAHESSHSTTPLAAGPFKPLLDALAVAPALVDRRDEGAHPPS